MGLQIAAGMKGVKTMKVGMLLIGVAMLVACGGAQDSSDEAAIAAGSEARQISEDVLQASESRETSTTQKLINLCVENGGDGEMCGCNILAMEEALGAEGLAKVAELSEQDNDAATDYLDSLVDGNAEIAMKMANSLQACLGG